ncbi:MAG: competence/damage-inducible protein A, partial [Gemmatimonadetes bacterium]|nr:competence/damage-inducible protein A [Gemmatimonadota bacterium]
MAGVEIVTIGNELLLGFTIDTNAAWLARQLSEVGIEVVRRASVGDAGEDIVEAVRTALDRTGAVITTGGLGPTADDITKPAIAALFGRELYFDEGQWEHIRTLWRTRRGTEPPEVNRQQVMLPVGCHGLTNRHGTAPGIWLEDERGRWVAMLPGVPREMRGIYTEELGPRLSQRAGATVPPIRSTTVRTTGIAESSLPERLGDAARGVDGLSLAYLPGQEGVDLRLTARGLPAEEAERRLAAAADLLVARVGNPVYGRGTSDLADVVLQAARAGGHTIAVAESCTGGMLGERLTAIAGSSDVFLGGVIAYANAVKEALLHVDRAVIESQGAVSLEVARAMAAGARASTGATIGIGITGVAGPGGGSPDKPVGTVCIGVDISGSEPVAIRGQMIGDRAEIRFRATQAALDLVRRRL